MEKAVALPRKLDSETASGVLRVIKRNGITGYGAQYFSTNAKRRPHIAAVTRRPHMRECDQDISSVALILNARSRHPTAPTRVMQPRKSMRYSFW